MKIVRKQTFPQRRGLLFNMSSAELGSEPRKHRQFRRDSNVAIVVSHCFSSTWGKLTANHGIHVAGCLLSLDALFSMVKYFQKARFNMVPKQQCNTHVRKLVYIYTSIQRRMSQRTPIFAFPRFFLFLMLQSFFFLMRELKGNGAYFESPYSTASTISPTSTEKLPSANSFTTT